MSFSSPQTQTGPSGFGNSTIGSVGGPSGQFGGDMSFGSLNDMRTSSGPNGVPIYNSPTPALSPTDQPLLNVIQGHQGNASAPMSSGVVPGQSPVQTVAPVPSATEVQNPMIQPAGATAHIAQQNAMMNGLFRNAGTPPIPATPRLFGGGPTGGLVASNPYTA